MKTMTNPIIYVTRGLPGSGKTTWAKTMCTENPGKYKLVSKDELRSMLDCEVWNGANERFLLRIRDFIIIEAVKVGKNVIVHDTNLHDSHIKRIRELGVIYTADVEIKDFDVSLEECIRRDALRSGSARVGAKVITDMYHKYIVTAPADSGDQW